MDQFFKVAGTEVGGYFCLLPPLKEKIDLKPNVTFVDDLKCSLCVCWPLLGHNRLL